MSNQALAKQIADRIAASTDAEDSARALLATVGDITEAQIYDVGAGRWLVVLPGWNPLSPPLDYVRTAVRGT